VVPSATEVSITVLDPADHHLVRPLLRELMLAEQPHYDHPQLTEQEIEHDVANTPAARFSGENVILAARVEDKVVGLCWCVLFNPGTGLEAEVAEVSYELQDFSTRAAMLEQAHEERSGPSIEDADIVVAGGRGLGKPEAFSLVEQLAAALGGAVGATRAVVDAGWYPYAAQVGQTGRSVAPKLYVACGISGAIQHKVGMQGSNVIVAINKDPNAPIFEFCDFGVVGDLHAIVPKLTELVRARKGS